MRIPAGEICSRVRFPGVTFVLVAVLAASGLNAQETTRPTGGERPQEQEAQEALVTIQAKDQPIEDVLGYIEEQAGVNIILAEGVEGTVTVELHQVPWRLALRIVADKTGSVLVQEAPNVVRVEQPPKVTFNFTGADVKQVIDAIAKYAGASVVISPKVEGNVFLRLKDVPWRTALDTVAKSLGYVVVEEQWGIYRIVTPETLQKQMVTRVFPIKYLRPPPNYLPRIDTEYAYNRKGETTGAAGGGAGGVGGQLDPGRDFHLIRALKNALSENGSLDYYPTNNFIVVKDIPPVLGHIERMLAEIDVEPGQVYIDVKFVTTSNTDALNYGVDIGEDGLKVGFTGGAIPHRLPFNLGGGGWNNEIIASEDPRTPGLDEEELLDRMTFGTLDFTGATFTLNLLKRDTDSRIVQAPKLLALDNQQATIFVGRTIRYAETKAESNQSGGLTFSIQEADNSPVQTGFQLYIVPHIVPETEKILLEVIPEAEQLVGRGTDPNLPGFDVFTSGAGAGNEVSIALPQIASSTLVSTMMLESGETAVIGGLITQSESETVNKLPLLGDIPILGYFFKNTRRSKTTESLYIFITPRIIRDTSEYERILAEEEKQRQKAIEEEMERVYGTEPR